MKHKQSFTLIAEGARSNWLGAQAAMAIGSCIPLSKIPLEELQELHAMLETEFRERDKLTEREQKYA
jgi:hypothetical protein